MSSMAAADNLNENKAIPTDPCGNIENSRCIATRLTTYSRLGKREKGAEEPILLRG
jgi:hypothetical protein